MPDMAGRGYELEGRSRRLRGAFVLDERVHRSKGRGLLRIRYFCTWSYASKFAAKYPDTRRPLGLAGLGAGGAVPGSGTASPLPPRVVAIQAAQGCGTANLPKKVIPFAPIGKENRRGACRGERATDLKNGNRIGGAKSVQRECSRQLRR